MPMTPILHILIVQASMKKWICHNTNIASPCIFSWSSSIIRTRVKFVFQQRFACFYSQKPWLSAVTQPQIRRHQNQNVCHKVFRIHVWWWTWALPPATRPSKDVFSVIRFQLNYGMHLSEVVFIISLAAPERMLNYLSYHMFMNKDFLL